MSKIYSKDEREQAVKLASEIGITAASRKLGITSSAISNWIHRKPKAIAETMGLGEDEIRAENTRLKKELAEKTDEVEILQAALCFFAKDRKK